MTVSQIRYFQRCCHRSISRIRSGWIAISTPANYQNTSWKPLDIGVFNPETTDPHGEKIVTASDNRRMYPDTWVQLHRYLRICCIEPIVKGKYYTTSNTGSTNTTTMKLRLHPSKASSRNQIFDKIHTIQFPTDSIDSIDSNSGF